MMGKRKTTEEFVSDARAIHGDRYDYSLVDYKRWDIGVRIVCRKHGEFIQRPTDHLQNCDCPKCSREEQMKGFGKELEIVEMYRRGFSGRKIGRKLGMSDTVVLKVLQGVGEKRRRCGRQITYLVNHEYFNTIDTPEKAYWLGWMASDGYVVHGKHTHAFGIGILEKDVEILEALKMALAAENPIRRWVHTNKKAKMVELRIVSLPLVEALEKLGIVPNKSKILKCPQIAPDLMWDFFRGMFDGDGYVGPKSISLCGTKDTVEAFAELCRKSEYSSQVYKHSRGTATWYMRSSGRNARGILSKLYERGIGLSRKKGKAEEWISRFAKRDGLLAA